MASAVTDLTVVSPSLSKRFVMICSIVSAAESIGRDSEITMNRLKLQRAIGIREFQQMRGNGAPEGSSSGRGDANVR